MNGHLFFSSEMNLLQGGFPCASCMCSHATRLPMELRCLCVQIPEAEPLLSIYRVSLRHVSDKKDCVKPGAMVR